MRRRAFVGLLFGLAVPGCLSNQPSSTTATSTTTQANTSPEEATQRTSNVRRGGLTLLNFREEPVNGQIVIAFDGADVLSEQFSLEESRNGNEGSYKDYGIVFDEHGEYEVSVHLDEGLSKTKTVTYNERDWYNLQVYIKQSAIDIVGIIP